MKLSVVMMIKNESKYLERCLQSIKPIQAAIDAEIIIVDTGSEDNSVEIAKKYTNKVYFHSWNNDFAAIRNITIGYATGEWIFVLDGDEVIERPEEFINFFQSKGSSEYNTGIVKIKSFSLENETLSTVALLPRLFRNDGNFKYTGAIHEQPHSKPPRYFFKTNILHYGYISNDPELMERKFVRNTQILNSELEREPENLYYWFQLAQSYQAYGKHEEALEANLMAYELAKKQNRLVNSMYIYIHLARVYLSNNRYEELESLCLEALSVKDGYLDLYYILAVVQQRLGKNIEAIKSYNIYLDMCNHYEDFEGSRDITVTTCTLDFYEEVYTNLCNLYFELKQYEKTLECMGKIHTENYLKLALSSIIKAYIKLNMYNELKTFYDTKILIKNKKLSDAFTNILETDMTILKKQDKNSLIDIFSHGESLYCLLNLMRKEVKLDIASVEKLHREDFNNLPMYYGEIFYYLLKYKHMNINALASLSDITIESYFGYLINMHKKECAEDILSYMQGIADMTALDDIRIRKKLGKVLLLSGLFYGERYEQIFKRYIRDGVAYLNQVYNRNIILNEQIYHITSEEDIFLLYIFHAEKRKATDSKAYISYLKKALLIYPAMVKGIEALMKNVTLVEDIKIASLNELEAYKKQFKESIQSLISQGLLENVNVMIDEYEKIVGNDIDIYSIKAVIAMLEGNVEKAESILLEGVEIDNQNFDLLYNLGYLYQSNAQDESAVKYYKAALRNAQDENDRDSIFEILQGLGVHESKHEIIEREQTDKYLDTASKLEKLGNKSDAALNFGLAFRHIKNESDKNRLIRLYDDNDSLRGIFDAAASNLQKRFIVLSSCGWGDVYQRMHHIARSLAKFGHEVIYITPSEVGKSDNKNISIVDLTKHSIENFRIVDNVKIFTPITALFNEEQISNNYIHLVQNLLDMPTNANQTVIITYMPYQINVIDSLRGKFTHIYECVDDHSDLEYAFWGNKNDVIWEQKLMDKADAITTTAVSLFLQRRAIEGRQNVYLSRNAVNESDFILNHYEIPDDLKNIPEPRIAYIGAVYEWFDADLFYDVVKSNPDKSFVIIGFGKEGILEEKYPNLYILGAKKHNELKNYLYHMDIGIIPFKSDVDIIVNCDPIKQYEYIACGLPVITTYMPEAAIDKINTFMANTKESFNEAIEKCLSFEVNNNTISNFLAENSWNARAALICQLADNPNLAERQNTIYHIGKILGNIVDKYDSNIFRALKAVFSNIQESNTFEELAKEAFDLGNQKYVEKQYLTALLKNKNRDTFIEIVSKSKYINEELKAELKLNQNRNDSMCIEILSNICIGDLRQALNLLDRLPNKSRRLLYQNYIWFMLGKKISSKELDLVNRNEKESKLAEFLIKKNTESDI